MSIEVLERRFATIGARLEVSDGPWLGVPQINVLRDGRGEYFDLRFARGGGCFCGRGRRLEVERARVLRNEPVTRGRGKPHVLEFAYRRGGEKVYVSFRYPHGMSEAEYARLSQTARRGSWQVMVRNAE